MNRNNFILLTFAVIAAVAAPAFAIETRSYQFSSDNRPFRYQAWGPAIDAELSGTFDLVLDQSAGTAQLTNLQARIVNSAYAPPNQNTPLTPSARAYFDNVPLSTRWPTNLTTLTGHFLASDLLEFDGPNTGLFLKQDSPSSLPYFGGSLVSIRDINAADTALQLKFGSGTVTLTGVANQILWNDAPYYYLLGAQATLIPEPSSAILSAITMIAGACLLRRRKSVPHNRV